MKHSIYFSFLFLSLIVSSCIESANSEVLKIDPSYKSKAKTIQLEEIRTKDALEFAEVCYVFDSVLVVQNFSNSNKYFLEFYDLSTMNLIKQSIMRGNGPGELIEVITNNSKDYLVVDGYMNHKYAKMKVMDFLNDKESVIDYKDYSFRSQGKELIDDNHFLVVNPYRFINKKLKVKQDCPRFVIMEGSDKIQKEDGQYSAININTGGIMINENKQRICYYSRDIAEFEIYDFNLNLLKTIKGPDKIVPDYSISGKAINYQLNFPHSYTFACYDDNNMFLAYEGRYLKGEDIIKTGGKVENSFTWIFKFDWDGRIAESYLVDKDRKIVSMSITSQGELYLCCEVEGIIKLYKAII